MILLRRKFPVKRKWLTLALLQSLNMSQFQIQPLLAFSLGLLILGVSMKSPAPVKPKTSGAKIIKALNSNSSSSDNNKAASSKVLSSDEWGSIEAAEEEKGREDILDSRQMSQAPTTWNWLKQSKSHTYLFLQGSPLK